MYCLLVMSATGVKSPLANLPSYSYRRSIEDVNQGLLSGAGKSFS